ncbi:MerR family transcriptional regulator [Saccharopolyspora taberi]|uniref:MerR family transcriptional regulator n=1 Tax=Saccharopolyspora taberi TaxID=60895 RepID=A0ABN3VHG7_9PSEU
MERRLRPVDLARVAGISTQQVRNYADAGILPPVPRTDSGYRAFGEQHRAALLAYRALQRGFGPDRAQAIMRAVHDDDLPLALTLVDAGHAALHEQRRALRATGEALEAIAEQDTPALPRSDVPIGDAAAFVGVRTSALRTWESAGLLFPQRDRATGYRRFTPADVRDARMISMLRQAHYRLPEIASVLDDLRRAGSSDALRAAISDRQGAITAQATAMLEGASHLHHYVNDFR